MTANASVAFMQTLAVNESVMGEISNLPYSATGTRRVCLHRAEDSPLHVMLVESKAEASFPAHMHTDSDEISVAVKGSLEILVWSDGEDKQPTKLLLGLQKGQVPVAIIPKGVAHTTKARNANCVYLEVKQGPFDKNALVQISANTLRGLPE